MGVEPRHHRWLGVETRPPSHHVAVCSCGWRSDELPSAGLAGAAWDRHEAAIRDGDPDGEHRGTET